MVVNGNTVWGTNKNLSVSKEVMYMIKTGEYKMYGQLEEQAGTGDIEAFVFRNGEVVPADQAASTSGPVIHTAPEKNYGQLEEQANGNADIEAFVFRNGEIVPADQAGTSTGPVIHTSTEPNFASAGGNKAWAANYILRRRSI